MRGFHELAARGAEILLLYSASDGGLDELETYFGRDGRRLQRLKQIHLEILEGADHTFTARWARERFTARIEAHLDRVRSTGQQQPAAPYSAQAGGRSSAEAPPTHRCTA